MSVFGRIKTLLTRKKRKKRGGFRPSRGAPRLSGGPSPEKSALSLAPRAHRSARKPQSAAPPRRQEGGWRGFAQRYIIPAVFPLCILFLLITGYFLYGMPDISMLTEAKKGPSITIKSEDGKIIGTYGEVYGEFIAFKDLPDSLVNAVLATEDRNFFRHHGVDPTGIARALWANLRAGGVVQGGSTITQQVAKNVFLTPERTLKRKVQELLLAFWLESTFSKQEILSIYVNRVYLGAGNYGIDAAAQRYFGHGGRKLTLNESAVLAGLLKAPSRYSPTSNPERARQRGEQVLLNMVDAGLLKESEAAKARQAFSKDFLKSHVTAHSTLYFTDWIVEQIADYIGNVQSDLVITSTLNASMQQKAEEAVAKLMTEEGAKVHASQAALVAMTPEGAVRAMVGGVNYLESQYNRAVQAERQPGSSFKLFVYLAALEAGLTPDSWVEDKPVSYGRWSPANYTGDYKGTITARQAFAESINSISVQLAAAVGVQNVIGMAERLGIGTRIEPNLSIALGTNEVTLLDLTNAYAHLASGGRAVFSHGISEIMEKPAKDRPAKILYRRKTPGASSMLSTGVVQQMNNMLLAVVSEGTGRGAAIGRPAAGKTGTTQEYRDAWFIGFTPQLVTGVWVGNDDNQSMDKITGGNLPAHIWRHFMQAAMAGKEVESIPNRYGSGFGDILLGSEPPPFSPEPDRRSYAPIRRPQIGGAPEEEPDFMDIIFGDEEPTVEYDYPNSR